MRNLIFILLIIPVCLHSQLWEENFETQPIKIWVDSNSVDSLWQIGEPQKSLFNNAYNGFNVIVTDTINPYPTNSYARFFLEFELSGASPYVSWMQKIDTENGNAGGTIELTLDGGNNWLPIYDGQYYETFIDTTFNTIGNWGQMFDFNVVNGPNINDSINGMPSYQGSDTTWKNVRIDFFCMAVKLNQEFLLRYTFHSDSVVSSKDGWMIDFVTINNLGLCSNINQNPNGISSIYPNPAVDNISLELNRQIGHSIKYFNITDINGRILKQIINTNNEIKTIDVSSLKQGLYIIKAFNDANSSIGFKKIVIQ